MTLTTHPDYSAVAEEVDHFCAFRAPRGPDLLQKKARQLTT